MVKALPARMDVRMADVGVQEQPRRKETGICWWCMEARAQTCRMRTAAAGAGPSARAASAATSTRASGNRLLAKMDTWPRQSAAHSRLSRGGSAGQASMLSSTGCWQKSYTCGADSSYAEDERRQFSTPCARATAGELLQGLPAGQLMWAERVVDWQ